MVTRTVSRLNRKAKAHDPVKRRDVRIRNRIIILLLLPATIFVWLIGWVLSSSPALSRSEIRDAHESAKLVDTILEEEKPEILEIQLQ